jgi:uncharacterized membrane-anchored protein YitT (DUF2179 family)
MVGMTTEAAAITFGVGFAYDFLNASFIVAAQQKQPLRAALMSAFVGALALAGLLEVAHNLPSAPYLVAGYFAGTYIGVRYR